MTSQEDLGHHLKPRFFLKAKCINENAIYSKEKKLEDGKKKGRGEAWGGERGRVGEKLLIHFGFGLGLLNRSEKDLDVDVAAVPLYETMVKVLSFGRNVFVCVREGDRRLRV